MSHDLSQKKQLPTDVLQHFFLTTLMYKFSEKKKCLKILI